MLDQTEDLGASLPGSLRGMIVDLDTDTPLDGVRDPKTLKVEVGSPQPPKNSGRQSAAKSDIPAAFQGCRKTRDLGKMF